MESIGAMAEGCRCDAERVIVVDAANVIGSRPNGWWRDRAGAARAFVESLRSAASTGQVEPPVIVVLEGRALAGADEGVDRGVQVVHAAGAGDDAIATLAGAHLGATVVTADRALAARARSVGAEIVGPSWLLGRLPG